MENKAFTDETQLSNMAPTAEKDANKTPGGLTGSRSEPILKSLLKEESGSDSGTSSYSGTGPQTGEQNDISGGKRPRISSATIVQNDNYKRRALKDVNNTTDSDIPAQALLAGNRALRLSTWEGTRMSETLTEETLPTYSYNSMDDDEEPFIQKVHKYMKSQKGRDLTLGVSFGYAIYVAVFLFAIVLSGMFTDGIIANNVIQGFMGTQYSLSIISIGVLLFLGSTERLTTNKRYMHQKSTAFIRGGMLALGTGGILYRTTIIFGYLVSDNMCQNTDYLVVSLLGIVFTILQMGFLMKYSKIEINKTLGLSVAARFLTMQIVATNLCLWINIIIEETAHELHLSTSDDTSGGNDTSGDGGNGSGYSALMFNGASHVASSRRLLAEEGSSCSFQMKVQELFAPYLFALMIEFCVVASTMVIAIWEKAGQGLYEEEGPEMELGEWRNRSMSVSTGQSETMVTVTSSRESDSVTSQVPASERLYSGYIGFLTGWIIIVFAFAVTVFCLYAIYSDAAFIESIDETVYGTSLVVATFSVVVIPVTMYNMSKLTFKDREIRMMIGHKKTGSGSSAHKNLERHLLSVTFVSLMVYRVFCIIAAVSQNKIKYPDQNEGVLLVAAVSQDEAAPPDDPNEKDELILLLDSIVVIIMAGMQTMFCNWFAFHKRATSERNLREKPGRQGLEFLRCINFSLWFLNSFLLKNPEAKEDQIQVFGETAWVILANVFHPLAILFYFHSFICMAEIMHRSYTRKYIGLVRMSKQRRYSQVANRKNANNLFQVEAQSNSQ